MNMNMKQHILAALREEFSRWEELLASMSEEQITTPHLPSHWSIKDVIAHLRAWQQRSIARLQAAQLNREPEFPQWPAELDPDSEGGVDETNAWIYETYREQPWSSVHRDWREGFLQFLELAEPISERDLLDGGKYPWLEGYPLSLVLLASYDHHQEHLEKTLAWLDQHGDRKIALHTLLTGLAIGESPRWHEGRLWFSNWGAQEVVAVDLEGRSEVVARVPTTIPFCIDWLPDGRLLVVSGREGLVLRREPDGSLATHADLRRLSDHAWNEIVVDGRGNIYVNGAGFGVMAGEEFAPGIIAVVTPDGAVRQVAGDIAFPNGMAVTPDNSTLIIAESYSNRLTAFDIAADGSLSNRRVWADVGDDHPDGICLDADGAVWYADVGNKRCVRVREGGQVLQTVTLDRGCFACMLGGADKKTLFMLAAEWHGMEKMADGARTGQVLTVQAPAPGVGWP